MSGEREKTHVMENGLGKSQRKRDKTHDMEKGLGMYQREGKVAGHALSGKRNQCEGKGLEIYQSKTDCTVVKMIPDT